MVFRLRVQIRIIQNVVESARFLAVECCNQNHLRYLQCIQEFNEVQVFGFLVLDGGIDIFFKFFDNLEPLIEPGNRAHDSAMRPHHVLQNLLALAPVGGLGERNLFFLARLACSNLFFQETAFANVVDSADGEDDAFQPNIYLKIERTKFKRLDRLVKPFSLE